MSSLPGMLELCIPVLELGQNCHTDDHKMATQINKAIKRYGCFYVSNHSISSEIFNAAAAQAEMYSHSSLNCALLTQFQDSLHKTSNRKAKSYTKSPKVNFMVGSHPFHLNGATKTRRVVNSAANLRVVTTWSLST